jgi:hypothetical protein
MLTLSFPCGGDVAAPHKPPEKSPKRLRRASQSWFQKLQNGDSCHFYAACQFNSHKLPGELRGRKRSRNNFINKDSHSLRCKPLEEKAHQTAAVDFASAWPNENCN